MIAGTMLHLSALAKLALTPFTPLRAAFRAVDWGRAFGLPGYEALVAKPVRIRTTTDPYYRGDPVQSTRRDRFPSTRPTTY